MNNSKAFNFSRFFFGALFLTNMILSSPSAGASVASNLYSSMKTEAEKSALTNDMVFRLLHMTSAFQFKQKLLNEHPESPEAQRIIKGDKLTLSLDRLLDEFFKSELPLLSCALLITRVSENKSYQADVLTQIASQYFKLGQNEQADQLLYRAFEITNTIEKDSVKGSNLEKISGQYAEFGQFTQALDIAASIEYEVKKAHALASIASQYARIGRPGRAIDIAFTIKKNDLAKSRALSKISDHFVSAGILETAYAYALLIYNGEEKTLALIEVANQYAESGRNDQADKLLSQALMFTKAISYNATRVRLLTKIAGAYAKVEKKEQTNRLLSQAYKIVHTTKDEKNKAHLLVSIAGKYADVGQNDQAGQLLSEAIEIAKKTEDAYDNAKILSTLADHYFVTGQKDKADELLSKALDIAKTDKKLVSESLSLSRIAVQYAKLGQFETALEISKAIWWEGYKASTLVTIAGQYAEQGRKLTLPALACRASSSLPWFLQ